MTCEPETKQSLAQRLDSAKSKRRCTRGKRGRHLPGGNGPNLTSATTAAVAPAAATAATTAAFDDEAAIRDDKALHAELGEAVEDAKHCVLGVLCDEEALGAAQRTTEPSTTNCQRSLHPRACQCTVGVCCRVRMGSSINKCTGRGTRRPGRTTTSRRSEPRGGGKAPASGQGFATRVARAERKSGRVWQATTWTLAGLLSTDPLATSTCSV